MLSWHDITHKHFSLTHQRENVRMEFCYTRFRTRIKAIGIALDEQVYWLEDIRAEMFILHLGTAIDNGLDKVGVEYLELLLNRHVLEGIPCKVCA